MPEIAANVVDKSLCTGCGTCAGVCLSAAVVMGETPDGRLVPDVSQSACTQCGLCDKCCPQLHTPQAFRDGLDDLYHGNILSAYLAKATEPGLLAGGQSGGPTTALLEHLLKSNMVDRVVVVSFSKSNPLKPVVEVLTDAADIHRSQGSKYCPVAMNTALAELAGDDLRTAIVGLGCHMQGLANAMEYLPSLRRNIVLRIGLFCSATLTYGAQDFLLRAAGATRDDLRRFTYRDKGLTGWPGDVCCEDADGNKRWAKNAMRAACKQMFIGPYCRVCLDKMNMLADIVFGDAYGHCNDPDGRAAVLTRTPAGQAAWDSAVGAGVVQSTPYDPEDLFRRQADRRYVTNAASFAAGWRKIVGVMPTVWSDSPWAQLVPAKATWRIRRRLGNYLAQQTAEGRRRKVQRSPKLLLLISLAKMYLISAWRLLLRKLRLSGDSAKRSKI